MRCCSAYHDEKGTILVVYTFCSSRKVKSLLSLGSTKVTLKERRSFSTAELLMRSWLSEPSPLLPSMSYAIFGASVGLVEAWQMAAPEKGRRGGAVKEETKAMVGERG